MTNEELKRIMYEDPERYQYIMRTAHSGRTGRIDRVYDSELDAAEPEQDYLSPSKAANQMAGYRPTLGREAVYNEASNDPYTTYMNSTYVGDTVNDTVNDTIDNTAKISQLEQQIAQVKERIARNERALSGKSYEDVNNKLAALEMKKINSQDPTMIWRWQQQRQDTLKANANVKSNEAAKFANTVDMWKTTKLPEGTAAREQMISNLNTTIRDGRNAGADVSDLLELKAKWEKITYGNGTGTNGSANYGVGSESEQLAGLLKTALETAKTSAELEQFKKDHPDLKAEQLSSVDTKIAELQKKEKANADERAFQSWVEKQTGKKYNTLTKRMQDTYRRIYKNRGK